VLRRLDGEWVTLSQYAQRVEAGGGGRGAGAHDTIRIVLAGWFLDELRLPKAPSGADRLLRLAPAATAG
jgi:hypothetical protein